jgi:hypothetical protein
VALSPELQARILHHYHVEKWRNTTIARHLGIHRSAVKRFLEQAGLPRIGTAGPSLIDAYWPFICQTLEKFPTLATSRLFEMVRQRGYNGSNSHFAMSLQTGDRGSTRSSGCSPYFRRRLSLTI